MRNIVFIAVLCGSGLARAEPLRLDAATGFTHFQQQVKSEIGTARGERLVEYTAFTLALAGAYDLHPNLAVGVFAELDLGVRRAGEFAGFDADNRATIDPAVGGTYAEIWTGVSVRGQWRSLFLDLGYAVFARRWDSGRVDLPASDGGTDGAFAPTVSVRWLGAIGGTVQLTACLDLVLRLEWRIRYYDERDGQPLMGNVIHGTQEVRPLVGVAWRPKI